jgi:hypothetical protein
MIFFAEKIIHTQNFLQAQGVKKGVVGGGTEAYYKRLFEST